VGVAQFLTVTLAVTNGRHQNIMMDWAASVVTGPSNKQTNVKYTIDRIRYYCPYLLVCSTSTILGTNGLNSADVPISNKLTNLLRKGNETMKYETCPCVV